MKKKVVIGISVIVVLLLLLPIPLRLKDGGTVRYKADNSSAMAPVSIEKLTWDSTYDKMSDLGEPNAVIPVEDESIVSNKGYYVTVEYNGLMVTLSAEKDFALTSASSIVAVTALSDTYTDSCGMKVGMSKKELMREYSLTESDFLSGKENAEKYRIPDTNFIAHNIPFYDSFYVAENKDTPIALIYLIKDGCINGILLRHLTAD